MTYRPPRGGISSAVAGRQALAMTRVTTEIVRETVGRDTPMTSAAPS